VKVFNPMPYELQITSSIPDDPRIEVVSALGPNFKVAPGDSAIVVLRVSPGAAGVTNGTITLVGEPCEWKLDVKYRVEKARLLATILPGTLDYGAGASCEAIQKDSFTVIRNGGTDPLVLEVGSVAAPFIILSPTTQRTLQPNDTVHAVIRFAPGADGTYNEVARFPFVSGTCNDTLKVTVRGAQQSVNVTATPTQIDFGTLEGCDDERSDTTVIRNDGSVDVTITLPSDPDVVYDPAGPFQLKAGDSVIVKVTIRPAVSGPFNKLSSLTVQPCNVSLQLSLTAQKNGVAFTTPATVSLGELNTCTDAATKTTSFTLSFDGTGTSTVESVNVGNELSTTLTAGSTLQSGTPQSFNLSWTPGADGALVDSMVVIFQPCNVRRVIRITGMRTTPALRAVQAAVPLGAIAGDATGMIRFENNGTDTLYVETMASANAVVVDARPSPLQPLLPGAFLEVDYRILCRDVIADTIRAFTSAGCILEASTTFSGTCEQIVPVVSATVVIDSAAVEVGDRFKLPIRLTQSTGLNQAGLYNWSAEIIYNPLVVVGMGNTPDCFVSGQYAPCTITVTGTRTDTLGVIGELDFTAVLGNAEQTDVILSRFTWTQDTTVVSSTRSGHIILTDICHEGGIRLLDPKSSSFNIRVYPIPASTTLTIDVRGMGTQPGTWSLGNYVGQIVDSGDLTPDANGEALVNVDVRTLASGTYFLTIDARGTVNRMPVLIQR